MLDVTDATFEDLVVKRSHSVPVVVDLWAPWCGPCRMIAPVLEDLAARYAGRLKVVKVNVDEQPALGARFDARSIPLLVVLRDGREVGRVLGSRPRAFVAGVIDRARAGDVAIASP